MKEENYISKNYEDVIKTLDLSVATKSVNKQFVERINKLLNLIDYKLNNKYLDGSFDYEESENLKDKLLLTIKEYKLYLKQKTIEQKLKKLFKADLDDCFKENLAEKYNNLLDDDIKENCNKTS